MKQASNMDELQDKAYHAFTAAFHGLLNGLDSNNIGEAMCLGGTAMVGQVHTLAALIGNREGATQATDCINRASLLFAALLPVMMAPHADKGNGTFSCDYSPFVVADTLDAIEKVLGEKPDKYLNVDMIKQIRAFISDTEAKGGLTRDKLREAHTRQGSRSVN